MNETTARLLRESKIAAIVHQWFDDFSDTVDAGYSTVGHEDLAALITTLAETTEL